MSAEHDIHVIDTAFQRDHFDAAYLLVGNGRGAFIDCGTSHSVPAMLAALESGADAVYAGFQDQSNARAFPGLNFSEAELQAGIAAAHARGRQVYLALNPYPDDARLPAWQARVDRAAELGADAYA